MLTILAEEQTIFGKWLEAKLAQKEMTQVELARRIKKTREQIRRIINGESGTRRETAEAIAIALGVPTRDALKAAGYDYVEMPTEETELTYEPSEDEDEVISYYRGISEYLRPAALAQLRALYEADKKRAASEEPTTFGERPGRRPKQSEE